MSDPPTETPVEDTLVSGETDFDVPQAVLDRISNREFTEWYSEQQFQTNILEGQAYFNGPSPPKDPDRHSPSKLLQCHRKASYARQNAPREGTPPEGLFWIGTEFEEQVIVPFLQDITTQNTYVTNSLWIDAEIVVDGTELRVRGSTDPAIVTPDAEPLLVTEIKTTTSLDHLSKPKPHHRAQLHAYLFALDREYDHSVTDGMIVYGSRKTLNIEAFHIEFDAGFWERVVDWMREQTVFERSGELPPATPERDWECNYCSFKHRCGQGDSPYADIGYDGLLPAFTGYDRQNLVDYLEAHDGRDARLTPALAHQYPELVDEYGAYDWSCSRCSESYAWDTVEWDGNTDDLPFCPTCAESGVLVTVSGPEPHEQLDVK
ncbi:CRISPR-associated protein Cas4 [Halomicrococcus sp. NG-SE-24]|uniref:CRISPR-associated protein Cas4 n=1 Tax=Halomicrococcus sp. NG-SE-24 TaxID=3436928 RepID=UPI003D97AA1C